MRQSGVTAVAALLLVVGVIDAQRKCDSKPFEDKQTIICYTKEVIMSAKHDKIDELALAIRMCSYNVTFGDQTAKATPLSINSAAELKFIVQEFQPSILQRDLSLLRCVLIPLRPNTWEFYDGSSTKYLRLQDTTYSAVRVVYLDLVDGELKWEGSGRYRELSGTNENFLLLCKARFVKKPPATPPTTRRTTPKPQPTTTKRQMTSGHDSFARAQANMGNETKPSEAIQQSSPSVQLLAFTCGVAAFHLSPLCIHWT